ncbi:hypothetical protein SS50377_22755 [Spironucleus salmonicida]|uniref:Uncharacterized protein n=1 Tax=Spironucleus salmonicida TaxID=348837 RepID=A0A9P8LVQ0_9EUKA|nr:hypothetical protein SS50377_22755 [Spironucleus salmonicida]
MRGGSLGSIRQLADQPAQNIILYEPRRWQLQDNSSICTSGVCPTPIQGGVYSQIVNAKFHQKRLVTAGGCGKDGLGLREKERNMVCSHLLVGILCNSCKNILQYSLFSNGFLRQMISSLIYKREECSLYERYYDVNSICMKNLISYTY